MKLRVVEKAYNYIILKRNQVKLGERTIIGGRIQIKGRKRSICIGDNTIINSDQYAVPLGYQPRTIFWTMKKGQIKIGNHCGISNATFCSACKIEIGDCVTIGGGVKVFDTDFHSLDIKKRMDYENDDDRKTKPVQIQDGVFIGAGSIILKGVTIGEEAVIGAGSVVTKDIPAKEIWAGNPARKIRNLS